MNEHDHGKAARHFGPTRAELSDNWKSICAIFLSAPPPPGDYHGARPRHGLTPHPSSIGKWSMRRLYISAYHTTSPVSTATPAQYWGRAAPAPPPQISKCKSSTFWWESIRMGELGPLVLSFHGGQNRNKCCLHFGGSTWYQVRLKQIAHCHLATCWSARHQTGRGR